MCIVIAHTGYSILLVMISKSTLHKMYIEEKKSANQIAQKLHCSPTKVNYWLARHVIEKRSISDSVYIKNNPNGDPYIECKKESNKDWFLYGLGLGLFWGEGNKVNKNSIRLGNTDPGMIKMFLHFLNHCYKIDECRLRFGLQIFSDVDPQVAKDFWVRELRVSESLFQKVVVTPSRSNGTYRNKNQYGVLTIYFSNTKLRDIIVGAITELQNSKLPT